MMIPFYFRIGKRGWAPSHFPKETGDITGVPFGGRERASPPSTPSGVTLPSRASLSSAFVRARLIADRALERSSEVVQAHDADATHAPGANASPLCAYGTHFIFPSLLQREVAFCSIITLPANEYFLG